MRAHPRRAPSRYRLAVLPDDDLLLLGPYATTPPRIADELIDALRDEPSVLALALFGSLAHAGGDGYSDIDLIVGHGAHTDAPWRCASAIRQAKPVRYYRAFDAAPQPAGRYWFDGESPFHQLDVCFYPLSVYERALREQANEGSAIVAREAWRREVPGATGDRGERRDALIGATALAVSADERERPDGRYQFLRATKRYLRGACTRADYDAAWAEFVQPIAAIRPETRTAGGRLGELVQECWQVRLAIDRTERGGR